MQHPGTTPDLAVTRHADAVADAACELADAAVEGDWSLEALDDTVEAMATLAAALGTAPLSSDAQRALGRLADAAAVLRAALGPTSVRNSERAPSGAASRARRRRRDLGHGGARQELAGGQ
ncbi:hypothetical protein [Streptomyces hydrogenans]|uniref:hypothetical protein n=1 Tax=Streptomyces hydrogenans TaxID=1873719 RepID=UPI0035DFDF17